MKTASLSVELPAEPSTAKPKVKKPKYRRTKQTNIVQYVADGGYHIRIKINGKLVWRSLKTKSLTVAKLRYPDELKRLGQSAESRSALVNGEMTFGQALDIYTQRFEASAKLKPRSKLYKRERIAGLLKSWPALKNLNVRDITEDMVIEWAGNFHRKFSVTNYNNTRDIFIGVLEIAEKAGAIYQNVAKNKTERIPVKRKPRDIPTTLEVFQQLFEHVKHDSAADLIRFLAYGGFRIGEAANITWADVNLERRTILIRGEEEGGTKNGEVRAVPIIPDMKVLLEKLQAERPDRKPTDTVMTRKSCQGSIDTACKKLGIPRFTHHAMRDYFITRCIEIGVPIPTVAQFVGHKDKGVTILKNYSHVLEAHAMEMAKKVTFMPSNVVALPDAKVA